MKPLSIGRAWEETVAFVKREGALLFPVAFLFLALPVVIFQQLVPPEFMDSLLKVETNQAAAVAPNIPPGFWIGFLVTMIVGLTGGLTLYALALRPGISVGEAMRLGLQRLPVLIGAGALVALGTVLALVALSVLAGLLSVVLGKGAMALAIAVAIPAIMFVAVRLLLLNALAIDRSVGPVEAVRQSWALTHGRFWRLAAFLAVLVVLSLVSQLAVQSVFGVLGGIVGGKEVGLLVSGLATAALSAVIQVYFMVMSARIYRQLESAA